MVLYYNKELQNCRTLLIFAFSCSIIDYIIHRMLREVKMSRTKKDGKSLNCVIDREIFEQLEIYCNEVGQTKTMAVERILKQFFSDYYNRTGEEGPNGGTAK